MRATMINPNSQFCGQHGTVYPADEYENVSKPYIFELADKDAEFDLAVDDDAFTHGHILLNGSHDTEAIRDFLVDMASRSEAWRLHISKMLDNGYMRVVYDDDAKQERHYHLTRLSPQNSL